MLPINKRDRKETPITTGVFDYFPRALAEVARVSFVGNQEHNPGEPLHWTRDKSTDHADCIGRHLLERGTIDTDGRRHSGKLAWRALANLELELEAAEQDNGVHQAVYDATDAVNAEIVNQIREGTFCIQADRASRIHLDSAGRITVSPLPRETHGDEWDNKMKPINLISDLPDSWHGIELTGVEDAAPGPSETTIGNTVHGFTGGENGVGYSHPVGADISIHPNQEARWTNVVGTYNPEGTGLNFHGIPIVYEPSLEAGAVLIFKQGDTGYYVESPRRTATETIIAETAAQARLDQAQAYHAAVIEYILGVSRVGDDDLVDQIAQDHREANIRGYLADILTSFNVSEEVREQIIGGLTVAPNEATGAAYIAGPMRGYEKFNFPAFDAARDNFVYRRPGLHIISPADIDRAAGDDVTKPAGDAKGYAYRDFSTLLMLAYTGKGKIIMLPGWESSVGATAEFFLSRWLGLTILDASGAPLDFTTIDRRALMLSVQKYLLNQ